ncbi:MAG: hypothetical protein ABW092_13540, partial [Candidatus Thiodiazotropha sp.]
MCCLNAMQMSCKSYSIPDRPGLFCNLRHGLLLWPLIFLLVTSPGVADAEPTLFGALLERLREHPA